MSTSIGEKKGKGNYSQTFRAMNLKPDEEQVSQYDHYPAKGNPIRYVFIALAGGSLLLTLYLFANGHWVFGIIGIVGILILALLTYSFGNAELKKRVAYESGLLLPAIIVNTNPVELMVMANMGTKEDQERIYGLLKMPAPQLPGHKGVIGEKVPCVSLFGSAKKGYKKYFEPRPLSCGFINPALITMAIEAISKTPTENRLFRTEWEMLSRLRDKIGPNTNSGVILFFDKKLNQVLL